MMLTTREEFIILVDNDTLKPSDAIVLLEGDGLFRVNKAVELYHENYSKKILALTNSAPICFFFI